MPDGNDARCDGDFRSQAVENVDGRHGYTYEFSPSPNNHLSEYDEEEARLRAAHSDRGQL